MFRRLHALTKKLMIASLATALSITTLASSSTAAKLVGRIETTDKEEALHQMMPETSEQTAPELDSKVLRIWRASSNPQAVLVVLHGFGLHKEAFEALAKRMIQQNITVYGLDARGFGGWLENGKSGNSSKLNFRKSVDDVYKLVQYVHHQYPQKPVFVLGESMGGATALAYAANHSDTVNGVILSVPAYKRVASLETSMEVAANFLLHAGRKVQLDQVMVARASHNPELRRDWHNDPQARLSVSLTDLMRFSSFMKQAKQYASQIEGLPVLLVQGEQDKLIKPSGTAELFNTLPTAQKELLALSGHEHLIFEQGQFDQPTFGVVTNWIERYGSTSQLAAVPSPESTDSQSAELANTKPAVVALNN